MRRIVRIAFVTWIVVVCALIGKQNPKLFSKDLLITNGDKYFWRPISFETSLSVVSGKTFFYRGNLQREARFTVSRPVRRLKNLWKTELFNVGIHGASKASPISDGHSIFIGSDTGYFYCFDLQGKLRWKFYLGSSDLGIHSTAALDEKFVYIGTYRGAIYRIHKETGHLSWMRVVGETVGSSSFLEGNALVVAIETVHPRNGYVIKLNRNTGELIWKTRFLGEQSHSSPALSIDKKMVVLGANNKKVFGIDYATGKIAWGKAIDGEVKSTPVIEEDFAYLTTRGNSIYKFRVSTGQEVWKRDLGSGSQVSPILLNSSKLVVASSFNGDLVAFQKTYGKEVWRKKFKLNLMQISSPVVLQYSKEEAILFYCESDFLCLIDGKGTLISKVKLSGRVTSSPLVWDDKVFVSINEGGLEALSLQ